MAEKEPRSNRSLFTFARMKPGVDLARARADVAAMAATAAAQFPTTNEGWSAMARPLADEFIPDDVRLVLLTMMGAVTLVLLIACANVANLMLARASGKQREFSVRAALGAGRAQLVRQLLTECVLLGLAAAPIGLAVAYFGVWLLDGAVPPDDIPYYINWEISPRVIAYTVLVSALTGLVFGLAPALQAGRLNLTEALRDGARGSGQSGRRARVRNGLVVAEVALALVLLVGASLFVRSFLNLQSASAGFDTGPLLTLRFFMTSEAYPRPGTTPAARGGHHPAHREPARCGERLRLELHPAGRRRWRRAAGRGRRPHRAEGRGAQHPLHRRHAATSSRRWGWRRSRAATSPMPKARAGRRWR